MCYMYHGSQGCMGLVPRVQRLNVMYNCMSGTNPYTSETHGTDYMYMYMYSDTHTLPPSRCMPAHVTSVSEAGNNLAKAFRRLLKRAINLPSGVLSSFSLLSKRSGRKTDKLERLPDVSRCFWKCFKASTESLFTHSSCYLVAVV